MSSNKQRGRFRSLVVDDFRECAQFQVPVGALHSGYFADAFRAFEEFAQIAVRAGHRGPAICDRSFSIPSFAAFAIFSVSAVTPHQNLYHVLSGSEVSGFW